jgi:c-di-GMP-binding flagellar brake protein YcgR
MSDIQERRQHERTNVRFTVTCEVYNSPKVVMIVGGRSLYALMIDLSEGGMAIETKYNLPVKSILFMKFTLINHLTSDEDNRFRTMEMVGEVRNNIPFEEKEYRIGIMFTQIAEEDKRAIKDFVKTAIKPREPY